MSGEIGPELLERWALDYLGRYASSAENLRRVLIAARPAAFSRGCVSRSAALIDALVARYRESGLLDDAAYAAGRVQSLHRRGDSLRAIRARLAAKGVAAADVGGCRLGSARQPPRSRSRGRLRLRPPAPARTVSPSCRRPCARARRLRPRRVQPPGGRSGARLRRRRGGRGAGPRRARLNGLRRAGADGAASSSPAAVVERGRGSYRLSIEAGSREVIPCLSKAILTSRLKARPTTSLLPRHGADAHQQHDGELVESVDPLVVERVENQRPQRLVLPSAPR